MIASFLPGQWRTSSSSGPRHREQITDWMEQPLRAGSCDAKAQATPCSCKATTLSQDKIQAKREQNSRSHLAKAMSSHCFLLHVGQVQLLPGTTASLCDGNTMRAARALPSHMSSTWQGVAGYPKKSACRTQHCIAFSEAMAIHKMFCGSQQIPQSCRGLQTMENQLVCASPAGSIAYMPVQMTCAIIKAYVTNSKKAS